MKEITIRELAAGNIDRHSGRRQAHAHPFDNLMASRATHAPMFTIKPVSSARGIKSLGLTNPGVQGAQRIKASAPPSLPERATILGW
jgi:hypothetical protein